MICGVPGGLGSTRGLRSVWRMARQFWTPRLQELPVFPPVAQSCPPPPSVPCSPPQAGAVVPRPRTARPPPTSPSRACRWTLTPTPACVALVRAPPPLLRVPGRSAFLFPSGAGLADSCLGPQGGRWFWWAVWILPRLGDCRILPGFFFPFLCGELGVGMAPPRPPCAVCNCRWPRPACPGPQCRAGRRV